MVLLRQAPRPAVGVRPVGDAGRAPDAEQVALAGGGDLALLVLVGEVHEHLHLDAARVAGANGGEGVGPDEEAAVADRAGFGRHVHPVELRDEVLILLVGSQVARRLARGDDLAVLDEEGAGGAVDVHPARQVLAVEHGDEAVLRSLGVAGLLVLGRGGEGGKEKQQGGKGIKQSHDDPPRAETFERVASAPRSPQRCHLLSSKNLPAITLLASSGRQM